MSGIPTLVVAPAASAKPPFDPMPFPYCRSWRRAARSHRRSIDEATSFREFIALAKDTKNAIGDAFPAQERMRICSANDAQGRHQAEGSPIRAANLAMVDLIAGHVPLGVMSWSASIEDEPARSRRLRSRRRTGCQNYPRAPILQLRVRARRSMNWTPHRRR